MIWHWYNSNLILNDSKAEHNGCHCKAQYIGWFKKLGLNHVGFKKYPTVKKAVFFRAITHETERTHLLSWWLWITNHKTPHAFCWTRTNRKWNSLRLVLPSLTAAARKHTPSPHIDPGGAIACFVKCAQAVMYTRLTVGWGCRAKDNQTLKYGGKKSPKKPTTCGINCILIA